MLHWILIGLVAGWLTGKLMRGRGYGMLADILLGLIGGVIGGWIFGTLGIHTHSPIGAIATATVGACALVAVTHVIGREI